jgi:hypothetical protein
MDEFIYNFEDWIPYIIFVFIIIIPIVKGIREKVASGSWEQKMKVAAQSIGYTYVEESSKTGNKKPLHVLKGSLRGYASRVYYRNEKRGKETLRFTIFEVTVHGVTFPDFNISTITSTFTKYLNRWFGGGSQLKFGDPTVDESISCKLTDVVSEDDRMEKEHRVRQLMTMGFLHNLIPLGNLTLTVKGSSIELKMKGFLVEPVKFSRAVDVLRMMLSRV